MTTSRGFVQITDKEINKIKVTCVIIHLRARWFSGNIHLDFVSVNIPR